MDIVEHYLSQSWITMLDIIQSKNIYLLHPKTGGAHQKADQAQVKTMPAVAHLPSNFTFPKGLHTTTHLSNDMKVRDHRPAIPAMKNKMTLH